MKISIIIPVYDAERYLRKCVDSVLHQTYRDWELILVDDGSTDSSAQICDQYAAAEARVSVLHKPNGGTSDARNAGIQAAAGDYITFMDHDDLWSSPTCLQTICDFLSESKADVLLFPYAEYWQDDSQPRCLQAHLDRNAVVNLDRCEALLHLMHKNLLSVTVWSKVVKTSLVRENALLFRKGIRSEDTEWTTRLLLCARSYDWCPEVLYWYRKGHDGAQTSRPIQYQMVQDLKNILLEYIPYAETEISDPLFRTVLLDYLAYPYSVWMAQSMFIKGRQIRQDKKALKPYHYILNYHENPCVKLTSLVYRFFGFTLTSRLLKFYMRRRYRLAG